MAVTTSNLIALAPELASVDVSILAQALAAVPLVVNLSTSSPFADKADLLTTYMALHLLALMGFGKAAQGRVISKGAAGVSVTYATVAQFKMSDLTSTPWGALYKLAVRSYGLMGAVT